MLARQKHKFRDIFRTSTGGSSRFAEGHELAAMRSRSDTAIPLCTAFLRDMWLRPFPEQRLITADGHQHIITIGPSRCGKGLDIIIPTLLTYRGGALLTDPKGEAVVVTAAARARMGQRVYVLDPFGVTTDVLGGAEMPFLSSYNPLDQIEPNSPLACDDIASLVEIMIADKGDSPFYIPAARRLLAALIGRSILYEPAKSIGHCLEIIAMEGQKRDHYLRGMLKTIAGKRNALCMMVVDNVTEFLGASSEIKQNTITFINNALAPLKSSPMRKVLKSSDLDFADLKRSQATVYLVLPPDMLSSHSIWLKMIYHSAFVRILRTQIKWTRQVLFMMDEFFSLGYIKQIETGISIMAGLGIKLMIFIQDVNQLKKLYESCWPTFLANSSHIVILGIGDADTGDEMVRQLGQAKRINMDAGFVVDDEDVSEATVPLLTGTELALFTDIDGGRMIVICNGKRPIRGWRRHYNKTFTAWEDYYPHPQYRKGPAPKALGSPSPAPPPRPADNVVSIKQSRSMNDGRQGNRRRSITRKRA